ncbi:MAG: Na(+)-translocating NADH-quinone reductase subunit A [Acidobacteriota bacterium]
MHKIKRGLDLPILGAPEQTVDAAPPPTRVALLAADYHGMKPTMHVEAGDQVLRGQLLFEDKKCAGVRFTSPGAGTVVAVNRGAKRAFQSVVVELDAAERSGKGETVKFEAYTGKHPNDLSGDQVAALLLESGLWTALRSRPFDKVADPAERPSSIFVTATDSNPLAPDPALLLKGQGEAFERGLAALGQLAENRIFICARPGFEVPDPGGKVSVERFDGPHPSGTVGLHIHQLDPVDRKKRVWHLGLQDVVAIGKLFGSGELYFDRIVALAGPSAGNPRHLRTRVGASLDELTEGEIKANGPSSVRTVSGSVLSGRTAQGEVLGFLGRHHQQVSLLDEGDQRDLLGWMGPGADKFSTLKTFVSALIPGKRFAFDTSTNGSHRAIVPVEDMYERVFPFDIEPAYLLKALAMGDIENAEALGVMELAEEDVALCSFVCASKNDYGVFLRDVLTTIEKEG